MKIRYCGNLHCVNTLGSFICTCQNGFEAIGDKCLDIDECSLQSSCSENAACENSIGSFTCTCRSGYDGELCLDVDECLANETSCDKNAKCTNTLGDFECNCNTGYYGNGRVCYRGQCADTLCPVNQECVSPTSMECECKKGFMKDGDNCVDINECLTNNCMKNSKCINTLGSFDCKCEYGFFGNETFCAKGSCTEEFCPVNENCVSPTSNQCQCEAGFDRNQSGSCVDIDECIGSLCDVNAVCHNTLGSFECFCNEGYLGNGRFCARGKCTNDACPENQQCISERTIACECKKGWVMGNDNICIDFNECLSSNDCHKHAQCLNTAGSYECACRTTFVGDGKSCTCPEGFHVTSGGLCLDTNECLQSPCHQDQGST